MTRILHVEDDALIASSIGRMLKRMGIDVDNATDVIAAVELLESGTSYDAIVSDFNLLNGTTGGQLITWVREHLADLAGRFLFLTSKDVAEFGVPSLTKPCEPCEFRAAVSKIISQGDSR